MLLNLNHKSLNVWKGSMAFAKYVKRLTKSFPPEEKYELTRHCNRTMVSVLSNISEGSSRPTPKDRRRFYVIARSSLVELDTQLEIAIQFGYIGSTDQLAIKSQLISIFAQLSALIRSTR